MALIENGMSNPESWLSGVRLMRQLEDYTNCINNLIWQRQAIFFAATMLAAAYYSSTAALICYAAVLMTELLDLSLARRLEAWQGNDTKTARRFLATVMANTALSALGISLFVIVVALQQGSTGHFTPMFFLFAAALFAAMNNHQLVPALILRLTIYGATFLFIASIDIWR